MAIDNVQTFICRTVQNKMLVLNKIETFKMFKQLQ